MRKGEKKQPQLPTQAQNILRFCKNPQKGRRTLPVHVQNILLFCKKPQKKGGRTWQRRAKYFTKKGRTQNAIHPLTLNLPHRLSAEFQALNQRVVSVERSALEIVEQLPAAACHSDKPAARMEVFLIC